MAEKKKIDKYRNWRGRNGLLTCPKCGKYTGVTHITIPWKGETLICRCGYEEVIGPDDYKVRQRGVTI